MKKIFTKIVVALVFISGICKTENAAAISIGVTGISVGSQSAAITAGTSGSVTYSVTVSYNYPITASPVSAPLGITWTAPTGATTSFSPSSVNLPGAGSGTLNSTLTINYTSSTPAGNTTFQVTCQGINSSPASSFVVTAACINPTVGGTIASSQAICSGASPAAFTSSAPASGQTGTLEYKWQSSAISSSSGFADIPSSNSTTYSAGVLTANTWYKRLSRVTCKADWVGAAESNVLAITVPSIVVTNNNDAGTGSLRQAIINACDGATITFDNAVNGQTIFLTTGELSITKALSIDATSLSNGITVDGSSASRCFNVNCAAAATVNITKVNMNHGSDGGQGGGLYMDNANTSLNITNCTIQNCAAGDGAGIYQNDGSLALSNCTISNNTATYNGGGLFSKSTVTITSGSFNSNSSLWGGGWKMESGNATATSTQFISNAVVGNGSAGGAVYLQNGTMNLTTCTATTNQAVTYGAGIYVDNIAAVLNIKGGSISSNTVTNGFGGGLFINNGTVRIYNNANVNGNGAQHATDNGDGGGIYLMNGTLKLDTCNLNNNTAYRNGGGIMVTTANAFLIATGNSISNNYSSTDAGGGVYIYAGNASFTRSNISSNSNTNKGAGVCVWSAASTITLDLCTINSNLTSNNAADANYGAGLFINNASVTVSNSTFTANRAYNSSNARKPKGGAIYLFQGTLTSTNNVFVSNSVNTTGSLGGAIFNDQGIVNNTGCSFTTDSAGRNGGAIYNNAAGATTTNTSCIFTSNYADVIGGAIDLNNGSLNNTYCVFTTNKSNTTSTSGAGGAIYHNLGTSVSKECTFIGNTSYNSAAVDVKSGSATFINSLFYSNAAQASGGAFVSETNLANSTLTNCTFYGNSAVTSAGAIGVQNGTVAIKNSIIWGNTSPDGAQIKNGGTVNLFYTDYSNSANDVVGTITPTSCISTYPVFSNAAGNDFKLAGNSPCLDAGNDAYNSETFDIRGAGFSRKLDKTTGLTGTIDMGAFEYKNGTDPIFTGPNNPTAFTATVSSAVQIGLSWALNANNNNVVVAWNSTNTFGTPSGTLSSGTSIPGGGTVIYVGNNTSYNHSGLTPSTQYFYKIWSVDGNVVYSSGTTDNATTFDCINPTVGGAIGNSQSHCGGFTPTTINSSIAASGQTGTLEYKWQWSIASSSSGFTDIGSSNSASYSPAAITQTTWYKRLARVDCKSDWTGAAESNVVKMTVNSDPTPSISGSTYFCFANSTTLSTGVYSSYLWTGGTSTQTKLVNTVGTYTVVVTDANSCTGSTSLAVTQNPAINVTSTITNVICKGNNTGAISLTTSGGTPGFSYLWSTASVSSSISALLAGNYVVTVTDSKGCTSVNSFNVSQPASAVIVSILKTAVRCGGKSTGSAIATATGGTGAYTYLWNTLSTSSSISNLPAGVYTVTVTDVSGCSTSKSFNIIENPTLTATVACTPPTATVSVLGGVPPYSYLWNTSPSQTTATATGLVINHVYKVKVTDSKNCSKLVTFTQVNSPPRMHASVNEFNVSVYPNPSNGIVNLHFGSVESYNYTLKMYDATGRLAVDLSETNSIANTDKTYDFSNLQKGIYVINIQSEKGSKLLRIFLQ